MSVRFRSRAGGDILMLDAHARSLQALLGRVPAQQGILLPQDMAAALAAIDAAVAADDQRRAAGASGDERDPDGDTGREAPGADVLPLRRRLWPMRELIRASLDEDEPIVWGV